jgi:hypothetical protein
VRQTQLASIIDNAIQPIINTSGWRCNQGIVEH